MSPLQSDNKPSTEFSDTAEQFPELRAWSYKRELILAFIFVVASYIFVLMFAKMASWELDITGGSKLAEPQLERCKDGNAGTPDEFCQMDCCWYSSIIRSGYDRDPIFGGGYRANWAFFPLFPLFASPWFRLAGIESTRAAVIGKQFLLCISPSSHSCLWSAARATPSGDSILAGALVAFNPGIIYAHGGYAEPLYFALAAAGLGLLDRRRWMSAGLAGGFLSATRPTGIVFVVAYAIAAVRSGALQRLFNEQAIGVLIGALLCPVGLSLWMLFTVPSHRRRIGVDAHARGVGRISWQSALSPLGWLANRGLAAILDLSRDCRLGCECLARFSTPIREGSISRPCNSRAAYRRSCRNTAVRVVAATDFVRRISSVQAPPAISGSLLCIYWRRRGRALALLWFLGGRSVV